MPIIPNTRKEQDAQERRMIDNSLKELDMNIYPKNSLIVREVVNGFVVQVKGTIKQQEDNEDGEYAFAGLDDLLLWMNDYYMSGQKQDWTGY